jgi:hypothetical protein
MTWIGHWRWQAAAVLIAVMVPCPVVAETKLTYFNGTWHGSGTDRNSFLESSQQTTCRTIVRADLRRMRSEMDCEGHAGLRKVVHLTIALNGDQFTGELTQTTTMRGHNVSASVLQGSVLGRKTDDMAAFQVQFSALVPSVNVTLKLNNPSSYSMRVTTLGFTLMDVTFNRSIMH